MIAAKAVTYASTLCFAGGVFFLTYNHVLLAPVDHFAIRRTLKGLMALSILASGAGMVAAAGMTSGEMSGLVDSDLLRLIWRAGEGQAILARTAGVLLALPAVLSDRRPTLVALLGAGSAATSFCWVGHVHALASARPSLALGVHLLGVAFWVGALGPLLLLLRHGDPLRVAPAAARFGRVALFGVGALLIAGLIVLWTLIGGVPAVLWSTDYGRAVTLKLGLVACLLCFAGFNKLRLTPQLWANDVSAVRNLRRSISAEMILAAVILIVTASFTTLTGPPSLE